MKKRKWIKIALLGALALLVIGAVIHGIVTAPDKETYQKDKPQYNFYPANEEENIFEDEAYMELERDISYRFGPQTITIQDGNFEKYGPDLVFFSKYFDTVIRGDGEAYNKLFSASYFEKNEKKDDFTMQQLYDITVEKLNETKTENGMEYDYYVSYRIRRNNGTFRNDVDSDAIKRQLFHLVPEDGKIKIGYIAYAVYTAEGNR